MEVITVRYRWSLKQRLCKKAEHTTESNGKLDSDKCQLDFKQTGEKQMLSARLFLWRYAIERCFFR